MHLILRPASRSLPAGRQVPTELPGKTLLVDGWIPKATGPVLRQAFRGAVARRNIPPRPPVATPSLIHRRRIARVKSDVLVETKKDTQDACPFGGKF